MEDTGPQAAGSISVAMQGINVEAAVGRRLEDAIEETAPTTPKREADEELGGGSKRIRDETSIKAKPQSEDDNMVLVDADGKEETEAKVGEAGENAGPDAIDTSAV
jgi:hypothetical protein